MLLLVIWLRFVRSRLPKDLPFNLSFRGLIIILSLCIIYFIVLRSLVKPKFSKEKRISEYIASVIYFPLEELDDFLKQYLSKDNLISSLIKKFKYSIQETNLFYCLFAIVPRIILVTVLFLDVFLFNKLNYIYYFIFLVIFLWWNKYIIYSFKTAKKEWIAELNLLIEHVTTDYVPGVHPEDDPDDPDYEDIETMCLPVEIYINFQISNFIYNKSTLECNYINPSEYYYNSFREKNGLAKNNILEDLHWDLIRKEIKTILRKKLNNILELGYLIEYYNKSHLENKRFKRIKIAIFLNYLLCWLFILITSLPHTDWFDVTFRLFSTLFTETDPFSGKEIFSDLIEYLWN